MFLISHLYIFLELFLKHFVHFLQHILSWVWLFVSKTILTPCCLSADHPVSLLVCWSFWWCSHRENLPGSICLSIGKCTNGRSINNEVVSRIKFQPLTVTFLVLSSYLVQVRRITKSRQSLRYKELWHNKQTTCRPLMQITWKQDAHSCMPQLKIYLQKHFNGKMLFFLYWIH